MLFQVTLQLYQVSIRLFSKIKADTEMGYSIYTNGYAGYIIAFASAISR